MALYDEEVKKIRPPESHLVSAAIGWLELGEASEARREIDQLPSSLRDHPDVLEIRWNICAIDKDWNQAVPVAGKLVEKYPDRVSGWLHLSYALRRAGDGGVSAAWDALLPAYEKFPDEPTVSYNLACYACQSNQLAEAIKWLNKAIQRGGKKKIKAMALKDADLEILWGEIHKL